MVAKLRSDITVGGADLAAGAIPAGFGKEGPV